MAKRGPSTPPKSAPPPPDRAVRPPAAAPSSPPPAKKKAPSNAENKPAPQKLPEDLQVVFGENPKAARVKCGLKQSELAERTGLTQQYLSLIETGHQNVTLKTMMALVQVVGRHVRDMLRQSPKGRLPAR
jgi:DNA-binding XRE family transcriptional regulator